MLNRRAFLKAGVLTGVSLVIPWRHAIRPGQAASPFLPAVSPPLAKYVDPLPVPPVVPAGTPLSMDAGMHNFAPNGGAGLAGWTAGPAWGYNGASYLGPTRETTRGTPVSFPAANNLGQHPLAPAIDTSIHGALPADVNSPRASVHLHGGNTEAGSDGHPEDVILPGDARMYHYANDQEAATLWYHDHALGITRLNVMAGLAGFYLLRDAFDTGQATNPLGLPSGPYEVPLVIQDRSFNPDGSLLYPVQGVTPTHPRWAPEFFGDVAVVNGVAWPNLTVDRGLYRFRLLNGSNARFYNLRFSRGQVPAVYQIGSDGGLLNAPVPLNQVLIAPGERLDLLVDFSRLRPGTRVELINDAPSPFPDGPRALRLGGAPLREIMQFTVGTAAGFTGPLPAGLRGGASQPASISPLPAPALVRNMTLVEVLDPVVGAPLMALVNNLPFDATNVARPAVNTVEQWNIINTTVDAHPIHLHLVQFQLLGRQRFNSPAYLAAFNGALTQGGCAGLPDPCAAGNGPWTAPAGAPSADGFVQGAIQPPSPGEAGWKDTVIAYPGEITRIVVPFGAGAAPNLPFGASFTGPYVWHCHILEHEDNEMMQRYEVV